MSDFRSVFSDPYFGTPSIVMRRDVFDHCDGFDETLMTAEDIDLWLRAAFGRSVAVIVAEMWGSVPTSTAISRRLGHRMYADNLDVIEKFCRDHPQFSRDHMRDVRRVKARILTDWGAQAYRHDNLGRARRLLWSAIRQRAHLRPLKRMTRVLARSMWRHRINR